MAQQNKIQTTDEWNQLDEREQEIVKAYWKWSGPDESIEYALDRYQGTYKNLADYAESFQGSISCYSRDEENYWNPINFIDWQALGEDLERSGVIFTVKCDDGIMVFDNN